MEAWPIDGEDVLAAGGRRPDPGSRRARLLAWLLLIPLLVGVVAVQHLEPPPEPPESLVTPPGTVDTFTLVSKLEAKVWYAGVRAGTTDPALAASLMENLDQQARYPLERLRGAIVAGELLGPAEARARLAGVEDELDQLRPKAEAKDPGYFAQDLELMRETARKLRALYDGGGEAALSGDDQQFLVDYHGWFGRLALMHGRPVTDPVKEQLLGGGLMIMLLLILAGLGGVAIGITGLVLLIIAIVKLASGEVRSGFDPPAPGGSVYLETVAAFFTAFLLLEAVKVALIAAVGHPPWLGGVMLAMQWAVLPVIAWPLVRGVPWARLRADMGWHSGRGVGREIAAGVVGYMAGLPIFLLGVLVSFTAIIIREAVRRALGGAGPPEPPSNPIFDLVGGGSPFLLLMLYVLASVWAPIVEEAVFRGAFYRHLRARLPVVIAAMVTGLVFAAVHGYDVLMLGPVFALGFNFALLREWRGSLIAPMTAHALHNGVLLAFVIILISLLGG